MNYDKKRCKEEVFRQSSNRGPILRITEKFQKTNRLSQGIIVLIYFMIFGIYTVLGGTTSATLPIGISILIGIGLAFCYQLFTKFYIKDIFGYRIGKYQEYFRDNNFDVIKTLEDVTEGQSDQVILGKEDTKKHQTETFEKKVDVFIILKHCIALLVTVLTPILLLGNVGYGLFTGTVVALLSGACGVIWLFNETRKELIDVNKGIIEHLDKVATKTQQDLKDAATISSTQSKTAQHKLSRLEVKKNHYNFLTTGACLGMGAYGGIQVMSAIPENGEVFGLLACLASAVVLKLGLKDNAEKLVRDYILKSDIRTNLSSGYGNHLIKKSFGWIVDKEYFKNSYKVPIIWVVISWSFDIFINLIAQVIYNEVTMSKFILALLPGIFGLLLARITGSNLADIERVEDFLTINVEGKNDNSGENESVRSHYPNGNEQNRVSIQEYLTQTH